MKPEFNVGDTVTYNPYELELPAKVVAVLPNHYGDGRMVYELRQACKSEVIDGVRRITKAVWTFCSGEYIKESKLFEQPKEMI